MMLLNRGHEPDQIPCSIISAKGARNFGLNTVEQTSRREEGNVDRAGFDYLCSQNTKRTDMSYEAKILLYA